MRPGARTVSVNDPLIKKVIRLLSQLNDPRVDLLARSLNPTLRPNAPIMASVWG